MNRESNKLKFGLAYDFRNPEPWSRPFDKLYSEILDQVVWAEGLGYDYVWLTEHHFVEDGYSPSTAAPSSRPKYRLRKSQYFNSLVILQPL
jgi:hypothetical protein